MVYFYLVGTTGADDDSVGKQTDDSLLYRGKMVAPSSAVMMVQEKEDKGNRKGTLWSSWFNICIGSRQLPNVMVQ